MTTDRQYEVLEAIRAYKSRHGFSPSMRNLMELTGITSTSVVDYYLEKLEREGLIRRERGISRSIELVGNTTIKNKYSEVVKRIDQRKADSRRTRARKAEIAKEFRGTDAFASRRAKSAKKLEARIEAVVARALERETRGTGVDVVRGEEEIVLVGARKVG